MQKVLISIDTEGPAGKNPVDSLIFGRAADSKEYGIRYLMKLFDKYHAKGLFFVDIAEAWDYGENEILRVIKSIEELGHDVGVHLHPDHMNDISRRYLWQYSYDEQYEMLARCTDFYEKALGKSPLSFRAGRYGADDNTIRILERLGYKYDMSYFNGNRYCKISSKYHNKLFKIGKIIEVPVTSFKSFSTPFYERSDKLDSSMRISEFNHTISEMKKCSCVDVASFFVHSFSLLNWRKNPDYPKLDHNARKRFLSHLNLIDQDLDTMFIAESDLSDVVISNTADSILDISHGLMPYIFFADRAINVMMARIIRNI